MKAKLFFLLSGLVLGNPTYTVLQEDFLIGCGDSLGYQRNPKTSFGNVNYLVVWYENDDYNIYGARMSSDGTVLDPEPIIIDTNESYAKDPLCVFDGSNFFIIWQGYYEPWERGIIGVRLSPDGYTIDTCITISSLQARVAHEQPPGIDFNGVKHFVVWVDSRDYSNLHIYGRMVTVDGVVIDTQDIAISTSSDNEIEPDLSFDGINYLVIWQDLRNGNWDIYGARVSSDGVVIDTTNIPINTFSEDQTQPAITFGGANYLVVWRDKRNENNADIYGARVTPAGIVIEPEGFPISTASGKQSSPDIIFDGNNYFVVWEDSRNGYYDIYGAKVDTSGAVIDTFCISSRPGEQLAPSLAKGNNNQTLIAYSGWTGEPYNCFRIWGVFYPPVGIQENDTMVSISNGNLLQILSNPIKTDAIIKYILLQKTRVSLDLYDNSGRLIKRIYDGEKPNGTYSKKISLKEYSNGVYHLLLKTPDRVISRKLVLIK